MNINRVSGNRITYLYGNNKSKTDININEKKSDSLEISKLGKSLSSYSANGKEIYSKEKIEKIKAQIDNGTYNVDSKLLAKKIIDTIKGEEV